VTRDPKFLKKNIGSFFGKDIGKHQKPSQGIPRLRFWAGSSSSDDEDISIFDIEDANLASIWSRMV
jgi:hypothetical protein